MSHISTRGLLVWKTMFNPDRKFVISSYFAATGCLPASVFQIPADIKLVFLVFRQLHMDHNFLNNMGPV